MPTALPRELKIIRVLLFIQAAAYGIAVVVGLIVWRGDPTVTADLVWYCWPGAFALAFGLRLPKGRRLLMWSIFALELFHGLDGLRSLVNGQAAGLTQIIFPIVVLTLLMRANARAFFGRDT